MTNQTLVQKIRALLAKTISNGCTEAEAISALAKAQEMMAKYEVTPEEVTQVKRETAEMLQNSADDLHNIRRRLMNSIARFTETSCWFIQHRNGPLEVTFCGLRADVELADWLLDSLSQFVRVKLCDYLFAMDEVVVGQAVEGFVSGCIERLKERLRAMRPNTVNANALVVAKQALIRQATQGMRFRTNKVNYSTGSAGAFAAGQRAGNEAGFGRPVGQGAGTLRIGHQQ